MRDGLLLVNAPLDGRGRGGVYPSLSNLTLGSFLGARGWPVSLLDPSVDLDPRPDDPRELLERTARAVVGDRPAILGLSTMGPAEGSFAMALAMLVKQALPDLLVILGGSWATGFADLLVERFPFVDGVSVSAGEWTLHRTMEAMARSGDPGFDEVPGWVYRGPDGEVRSSGPPRTPTPEESAPLDPGLMAHPERYDIMVYLTGRGCPYSCSFCSEPFMFHGHHHEPLAKIREELRACAQAMDVSYMWLCDPLFGVPKGRLHQVLPELARFPTNYLFESRVDTLPPEELPDIRESGGDLVYLGLEAASDRSLLHMGKVHGHGAAARYREAAVDVAAACAAADVVPVVGVLNPVPGDTEADLRETLALLERMTEAAVAASMPGRDIRPFFHAFPYRIDRGTAAWDSLPGHEERFGTTCTAGPEELFAEREVLDASHEVDRERAARFRDQVRALNRPSPELMGRVLRSMPATYMTRGWWGLVR